MRINKREIISEIKLNNEDVLPVLSRKYFSSCRKILRMNGFKDSETPALFSEVLAHVYLTIQKQDVPGNIDFEDYFFRMLYEQIDEMKLQRKAKLKFSDLTHEENRIASDCVSILDERSRKLIYARVVEKLSYEKISQRFQYGNAVIAQQEFNRIYNQLEGIVKLRMNISLN
jgi:hypothetical protein